jgi:hypothetical protein
MSHRLMKDAQNCSAYTIQATLSLRACWFAVVLPAHLTPSIHNQFNIHFDIPSALPWANLPNTCSYRPRAIPHVHFPQLRPIIQFYPRPRSLVTSGNRLILCCNEWLDLSWRMHPCRLSTNIYSYLPQLGTVSLPPVTWEVPAVANTDPFNMSLRLRYIFSK